MSDNFKYTPNQKIKKKNPKNSNNKNLRHYQQVVVKQT